MEKTELQKEFENQTPTIKGVEGIEYLQVYCAWLENQVEKQRENGRWVRRGDSLQFEKEDPRKISDRLNHTGWVESTNNTFMQFCKDGFMRYGFNGLGGWISFEVDSSYTSSIPESNHITNAELDDVFERLVEYAKNEVGLISGKKVRCLYCDAVVKLNHRGFCKGKSARERLQNYGELWAYADIFGENICVLKNGFWAIPNE